MWVDNQEQAVWGLREMKFVTGGRQIGKTSALMQVIHEDFQGKVGVVVPNTLLADLFRRRYAELYPEDQMPFLYNASNAAEVHRGRSEPLFVDNWGMIDFDDRERLSSAIRCGVW